MLSFQTAGFFLPGVIYAVLIHIYFLNRRSYDRCQEETSGGNQGLRPGL